MELSTLKKNRWNTKMLRPKSRVAVFIALIVWMVLILIFSGLGDGFNRWSPWSPTIVDNGSFANPLRDFGNSHATFYKLQDTYQNASIRFAMSFIAISMISVFSFFIAKETASLIRANSKIVFYTLYLTIFFGYFFTALFYIVPLYFFNSYSDNSYLQFVTNCTNRSCVLDASRNINLDFYFGNIHVNDGGTFATFGFTVSIIISLSLIIIFDLLFLWKFKLLTKRYILSLLTIHLLLVFAMFSVTYASVIRGWTTLLLISSIAVGTDTFAYLFGKRFGRYKMIPHISPNKTWAGAIYGIVITTILVIGIIVLYGADSWSKFNHVSPCRNVSPQCFDQHNLITNVFVITFIFGGTTFQTYWWLATILIVIASCVICIVGDLLFSFIKRCYQIKDFGNTLGSHGGILDRFDSTATLFTFYLLYILIMVLISKRPLFNPNFYISTVNPAAI